MTKAHKYTNAIKRLFTISDRNYLTANKNLKGGRMIDTIDHLSTYTDWVNSNGSIKETITWTFKDFSKLSMSLIWMNGTSSFFYGSPKEATND